MSNNTENHGYETPALGTENWHEPLNQNVEQLDIDVEIRDVAENRPTYDPKAGAKFLELDTGIIYVGDGEAWSPALALAYYDDEGTLDLGELSVDGTSDSSETNGTDSTTTFGTNARAVHEGAIVFGDATQRSIWSKSANEIRSQMPIHAPRVGTDGAMIAGNSISASGPISATSMDTSSLSTNQLDAAGVSVDSESLTVEIGGENPQLTVEEWEIKFSPGGESEPALIIGDGIHATMPVYAPEFIETNTSARAAKTAIEPVDQERVLSAVESLPVNTWEYRANGGCRHMGPMAEDFREAFELGSDEESIATVDADGVALAAVQGLAQRLDDRTEEFHTKLSQRDDRIDALESENERLRARLSTLEGADEKTTSPVASAPTDE